MALATTLAALALQACAAPPGGTDGSAVTGHFATAGSDEPQVPQPFAEYFVKAEGVRLRYIERGTGSPPVVLLHGDGSMVEDFATSGLVDLVAERHRVVAFDRPGYGGSDRPRDRAWTPEAQAALLAGAFARLGIGRPIVVGHSWGTLGFFRTSRGAARRSGMG
jgi:Alpha/beta hydrolase family